MNRFIFFLLIPVLALGQTTILSKADFDNLEVYDNQYYCLLGWNGIGFFGKKPSEISLFSREDKEVKKDDNPPSSEKLNVIIKKFTFNKTKNEIDIGGYVTGGCYDGKNKVTIYIGKPTKRTDSIYLFATGRPTFVDGKKITKPYPIDRYENLSLNVKHFYQTLDGNKDEYENRHFDISFTFDENDLLVFGLSNCIPEIFELGKLVEN